MLYEQEDIVDTLFVRHAWSNAKNNYTPRSTKKLPRSELWRRMIKIKMPLEYREILAQLYEQVRFQVNMDSGFNSKYFLSNMGFK